MSDTETDPQTLLLPEGADTPNHPRLPVVIRPGALEAGSSPQAVCARLERNGWRGTWIGSVFDYHHFHPDAHEALAVARGSARLTLGGTGGTVVSVAAGDLLILPAGTGHCRLDQSDDFAICGAYPPGQARFTTLRAGAACDRAALAAVPLPATDPGTGRAAPLLTCWS